MSLALTARSARRSSFTPAAPDLADHEQRPAVDARAPLVLVAGLLLAACYARTLAELVRVWWTDSNYSHGFLVPPFALYLAWSASRSARHASAPAGVGLGETLRGAAKVLLGLVLHVGASLASHGFLDVLALVCTLRGATLLLGGEAMHRRYATATLFLVFMARLPITWHQTIAQFLQEQVSRASAACFEACGLLVCRDGINLHFPGYTLVVAEACSGMRQITTAIALAYVLGHFCVRRKSHVALLLLAALPLAVVANCLRVVASGLAWKYCGPELAQGLLHTCEGLATMGLVCGLLFAFAKYLASRDSTSPTPASTLA